MSIILIGWILILLLGLRRSTLKKESRISSKDIDVLVALKNEENIVGDFSRHINEIRNHFCKIILVNDYSDDQTYELLNEKLENTCCVINNKYDAGKKWAIKMGMEKSEQEYVLCMDADSRRIGVSSKFPKADLVILPVHFSEPSNLFQTFIHFEWSLLQVITFGLGGVGHGILCNGANLLINKKSYSKVSTQQMRYDIASGDDVFLLYALKKEQKKVVPHLFPSYSVEVPYPQNISEFITQRLRWSGKIFSHTDKDTFLVGGFAAAQFIYLVWSLLFHPMHYITWIYISIFTSGLIVVLTKYSKVMGQPVKYVLFAPIYGVLYPFYLMAVWLLQVTPNKPWKQNKRRKNSVVTKSV